ncbi:MAG TPA: S8 family serine peptidase [Vicinamibacteria bacterium]|nr:S8 family serine peptidase [Vicinamibacteria bacterium]
MENEREACALCGGEQPRGVLAEAGFVPDEVRERLRRHKAGWERKDGACPACVQEALLTTLLEKGEAALHEGVQAAWPLDAEAVFGALPTPLRLHADPRFFGKGVTIALVDAAFYPHPDLTLPRNRIRAWVDAGREPVVSRRFRADETPTWPGSDAGDPGQWHGLMTSSVAAGNGHLGRGLYRGLAPEAELVLVQVRDDAGRIGNAAIARALDWLRWEGARLGVRVVNLSLGGDAVTPLHPNPVDQAVRALVEKGMTVVVAAGNDGERRLVPPGTAPHAITVGGLDDRNTLTHEDRQLWHSNYGETATGAPKPEVVAPSLWVVAPILPASELEREAALLFARRAKDDRDAEPRLRELKMVTPRYQHVEGTSFAAPAVAGIVACMLEANAKLTPRRVRELLMASAHAVPGAPAKRQGAGAVDAGRAVLAALADRHGPRADFGASPVLEGERVRFLLHDHAAREVSVVGSWDEWARPGRPARQVEDGLWEATLPRPQGVHRYKFLVDGARYLADPANPVRSHDGYGAWNSVLSG